MVSFAALLILYNTKENVSYFYTPSELISADIKKDKKVRIGGFVENDSFIKLTANSFEFKITDDENSILVHYNGILPDLFREGQGAVIEGSFKNKDLFKATTVFAKHDENYIPSSIKKSLKDTNYWNKKY
tara:strand:+ start:234 stop:623 length:390 start_codon:yes stop_codon:yes gene_type:complete